MKKLVAIMLVLVALSASVFAGDSYLSFNFAPEFDFGFETIEVNYGPYSTDIEKDVSNGYFGIGVEWTNYFGDSSIAGLLLGFTYNIPMYTNYDGEKAPETLLERELIPRVGLALKFDLSDSFSLESGVSAAFAIGNTDRTKYFPNVESTTTIESYLLDIYGRLGIIWKFSGSWGLRAGIDVAYTLMDSISTQTVTKTYMPNGYTNTSTAYGGDMDEMYLPDLNFTPYIGIALCY